MEQEIWTVYKDNRNVKCSYKNLYEVSNHGRVRKNGEIIELKLSPKQLYLMLTGEYLHRIVAKLYIPNPDNKPQVDHIDGNRLNNKASNLRWVTNKENANNPNTIKNKSHSGWKHKRKWNLTDKQRKHLSEIQKGNVWIHLNNKTKLIHKDYLDYWLDDGWIYGRGKLKNTKKE